MEPGSGLVVLSVPERRGPKLVMGLLFSILVTSSWGQAATLEGAGKPGVAECSVPAESAEHEIVPSEKRVKVVAKRFTFVPSRIKVPLGTRLEIELTSEDVQHGFRITNTETDVLIPEAGRGSATVVFDALTKGRYKFQCSHQCGAGHASMTGVIVVKEGPE